MNKYSLALMLTLIVTGCNDGADNAVVTTPPDPPASRFPISLTYNFNESMDGIDTAIAIYDVARTDSETSINHEYLPAPFETSMGIKFQWNDLFEHTKAYIWTKISDLEPNTNYYFNFQAETFTNLEGECLQNDIPNNENHWLIATAFIDEPVLTTFHIITVDDEFYSHLIGFYGTTPETYYDTDGASSDYPRLGSASLPQACTGSTSWEYLSYSNDVPQLLSTNEYGEVWLFLSIDSNHANGLEIFITEFSVQINEQ